MEEEAYEASKPMGLRNNKLPKELNIKLVKNGYIISGRYIDDEKQVAKLLNEMLEIVQQYFEDKTEA